MAQYYYLDSNNQQLGPVDAGQLTRYGVTKDTHVWTEGMSQWQPAGSVPELSGLFPPVVTPPQMAPPFQQRQSPPFGQQNVNNNYSPAQQKPENYLIWAILATVLCCIPSGVAAIIYSNKVNTCWEKGDYSGAEEAANNAKIWCFVSLGLGVLAGIIGFFLGLAGALE
jgi:hypothetical protein